MRVRRGSSISSSGGGVSTLKSFLAGAVIGAIAAFLFDPQEGHRRRVQLTEKKNHWKSHITNRVTKKMQHLGHRSQGLAHKAKVRIQHEETPSDSVLEARIRSSLGRLVQNAHAIQVVANGGHVTLRGPILATEVSPLLSSIQSMRGVREILNNLNVYHS